MPNTRLLGPYELTRSNIASYVTKKMPGIFILGSSKGRNFRVRYIGRSDRDIGVDLMNLVGAHLSFKFAYLKTAKAAFETECRLFHSFEAQLDHRAHPWRTKLEWRCPYCETFG